MRSHTGRLYALAGTILVFFVTWMLIASRPWQPEKVDPRMQVLAAREARLREKAERVQRVVERRWDRYNAALAAQHPRLAARQKNRRPKASPGPTKSEVEVVAMAVPRAQESGPTSRPAAKGSTQDRTPKPPRSDAAPAQPSGDGGSPAAASEPAAPAPEQQAAAPEPSPAPSQASPPPQPTAPPPQPTPPPITQSGSS